MCKTITRTILATYKEVALTVKVDYQELTLSDRKTGEKVKLPCKWHSHNEHQVTLSIPGGFVEFWQQNGCVYIVVLYFNDRKYILK